MEVEYTFEELEKIVSNMEKYGGGFASTLAQLMRRADPINLKRIQNTWPDLMEKYLKLQPKF